MRKVCEDVEVNLKSFHNSQIHSQVRNVCNLFVGKVSERFLCSAVSRIEILSGLALLEFSSIRMSLLFVFRAKSVEDPPTRLTIFRKLFPPVPLNVV